jgi:hypothetical protein
LLAPRGIGLDLLGDGGDGVPAGLDLAELGLEPPLLEEADDAGAVVLPARTEVPLEDGVGLAVDGPLVDVERGDLDGVPADGRGALASRADALDADALGERFDDAVLVAPLVAEEDAGELVEAAMGPLDGVVAGLADAVGEAVEADLDGLLDDVGDGLGGLDGEEVADLFAGLAEGLGGLMGLAGRGADLLAGGLELRDSLLEVGEGSSTVGLLAGGVLGGLEIGVGRGDLGRRDGLEEGLDGVDDALAILVSGLVGEDALGELGPVAALLLGRPLPLERAEDGVDGRALVGLPWLGLGVALEGGGEPAVEVLEDLGAGAGGLLDDAEVAEEPGGDVLDAEEVLAHGGRGLVDVVGAERGDDAGAGGLELLAGDGAAVDREVAAVGVGGVGARDVLVEAGRRRGDAVLVELDLAGAVEGAGLAGRGLLALALELEVVVGGGAAEELGLEPLEVLVADVDGADGLLEVGLDGAVDALAIVLERWLASRSVADAGGRDEGQAGDALERRAGLEDGDVADGEGDGAGVAVGGVLLGVARDLEPDDGVDLVVEVRADVGVDLEPVDAAGEGGGGAHGWGCSSVRAI